MSQPQFFYDWDFSKFETTARVGQHTDVITRIYWTLTGRDDQGNSAPLYNSTEIPHDWILEQTAEFVPFVNISKEQCEELIETLLGEDEITRLTDNLKIQLEQLEATKVTSHSPPWLRS
jgi:hypothetical protein